MSTRPRSDCAGKVVVAVHDSASGRQAIRRGVAEARHRGCGLHLIRVWREIDLLFSMTRQETARLSKSEKANRFMLEQAAWQAQELAPDLIVTTELLPGDLYEALLGVSKSAKAIVLGDPAPHSSDEISQWLPEHAGCPVIVVSPTPAE